MWRYEEWKHLFKIDQPGQEPWWQAPEHILFQYKLAMICFSWFRHVLEVGSYLGTSASAYVQAIIDGAPLLLDCCDTQVTDSLRETLSRAGTSARTLEKRGVDAIRSGYDLVILDSDHRIDVTSQELGACLLAGIDTIILHDTNATWVEWCNGSVWARKALECHPMYSCVSDGAQVESGKRRWGLTVASRHPTVIKMARDLFASL